MVKGLTRSALELSCREAVRALKSTLKISMSGEMPNRVSAGFTPALPTPPSMRVRTRRLKQGNESASTVLRLRLSLGP